MRWIQAIFVLAFLAACGDDRPPIGSDAGGNDAATDSGTDAGGRSCVSALLCGSPPVCCAAGEECVAGACLPGCATEVRCGAASEVCCDAADVCLAGSCTTPGAACSDSFDCPADAFCEPTLGRCLPQLEPVACEVQPDVPAFVPVEEWHWDGLSSDSEFAQVLSTPVVADVDADGVSEVVFSTYRDDCGSSRAKLVIVDGRTGDEEVTVVAPENDLLCWSHLAVGNLDSDPELEIVGVGHTSGGGGLIAFEHDGTFKWRTTEGSLAGDHGGGAPALADMNGDGAPEVVFGAVVLAGVDGAVMRDHGIIGSNYIDDASPISAVADIDGDGTPDLVGGAVALRLDGTEIYRVPGLTGGYPAIADFFEDGFPDVVSVSDGQLRILNRDGTVAFGPTAIPGGGIGGAPTVADFDGDGRPEAATAGMGQYTVYDPDCTSGGPAGGCASGRTDGILWSAITQDVSSSVTGSSVFDFEADGSSEVVYNDECFLRVFDGRTGAVLLERPNSTRTGSENPVIVDVDGDNRSEIVVAATDDSVERDLCAVGTHGVFAFGDEAQQWVRTRRTWNQHAYSVTNVLVDGTVPAVAVDHWSEPGLNSFRQNVQGRGVFNAPDLEVLSLAADLSDCPEAIVLRAQITNTGSLGVSAGVRVAFYRGITSTPGALLGVGVTAVDLLPGATTTVEQRVVLMGDAPFSFLAIVDDDGAASSAVSECEEDDNAATIEGVDCNFLF